MWSLLITFNKLARDDRRSAHIEVGKSKRFYSDDGVEGGGRNTGLVR